MRTKFSMWWLNNSVHLSFLFYLVGFFLPLVGGPEYSDKLLETLELISGIQEQYVRDEVHSFFPLSSLGCQIVNHHFQRFFKWRNRTLFSSISPSIMSRRVVHLQVSSFFHSHSLESLLVDYYLISTSSAMKRNEQTWETPTRSFSMIMFLWSNAQLPPIWMCLSPFLRYSIPFLLWFPSQNMLLQNSLISLWLSPMMIRIIFAF